MIILVCMSIEADDNMAIKPEMANMRAGIATKKFNKMRPKVTMKPIIVMPDMNEKSCFVCRTYAESAKKTNPVTLRLVKRTSGPDAILRVKPIIGVRV